MRVYRAVREIDEDQVSASMYPIEDICSLKWSASRSVRYNTLENMSGSCMRLYFHYPSQRVQVIAITLLYHSEYSVLLPASQSPHVRYELNGRQNDSGSLVGV